MKKEELIKKLETVELPTVEVPSHRNRLKMALLNAGHLKDQVVSRKPATKVMLISGFAGAMLVLVLLTIIKPSFLVGPSDIVMAERMVQNNSQIRAALGGTDIALISILGIKDHKADVVITGTSGKSVNANVDLKQGTITYTVTVTATPGIIVSAYVTIDQIEYLITLDSLTLLSNEDKESALDIAKTTPLSSNLFSEGAVITGINPAHTYVTEVTPTDKPGIYTWRLSERSFGEHPLIIVELISATKGVNSILVDLNAGKVITIMPAIGVVQPTLKLKP